MPQLKLSNTAPFIKGLPRLGDSEKLKSLVNKNKVMMTLALIMAFSSCKTEDKPSVSVDGNQPEQVSSPKEYLVQVEIYNHGKLVWSGVVPYTGSIEVFDPAVFENGQVGGHRKRAIEEEYIYIDKDFSTIEGTRVLSVTPNGKKTHENIIYTFVEKDSEAAQSLQ